MSGHPPPLRQDERLALLCLPDERREDVLTGLLATTPVGTVATPLAGQRHPVDVAWLRARGYREASGWNGPDLDPLARARARDLDVHDGLYSLRSQVTSCGSGPGVRLHRRGVSSLRPAPWRSAPWGRMSAGKEGAQGTLRKLGLQPLEASGRPPGLASQRPFSAQSPCAEDCRCYTRAPSRSSGSLLKGHKGSWWIPSDLA
jgi:hypothetical protein